MPESGKKHFVIFTYLVLILSTLLVFWQVHNFDFINYDDKDYVYKNPHVSNGLTGDGVIRAFTTPIIGNWLPLTWLSFMLDCQLFRAASLPGGVNPGRMHLVNLFLHIANTLLLFAVLRKMTDSTPSTVRQAHRKASSGQASLPQAGALWRSAFVAAAFAIHPMHVESVAWIAERKDVLSTLFLLLTLASYVSYVKHRGLVRYLLTVLLFALGLLAKPMLVTLPVLLLLLDYWPLERIRGQRTEDRKQKTEGVFQKLSARQLIIEKVPFFALSAISSVITFIAQRSSGAVTSIDVLPLGSRIANVFLSYARYIGRMFWPQNLSVFYPFDVDRFAFWQVAGCVLLLLVISIFAICFGRKQKYLPVGWFWFVVTLIPVIGLVQSGAQSYADRYTYIPYTGLFIMIAWGLPELLSKWPQRKTALGLSMIISLTTLGICAHRQVGYWNNSITLFSQTIEVTQNNYIAYNNLGVACNSVGRYQDAVEAYKQAIRIKPDYADAHYNLGVACGKLGRSQDAIEVYKQVLRIKPDYADAYNNLGVACVKLGRFQEAIEFYKQAIRIQPDDAEVHCNLGFACGKLGRWQDSIEAYKETIRIRPDYADAHYNLSVACLVTGDKGAALEEYKILKTIDAEKANELFKLINKQVFPNQP